MAALASVAMLIAVTGCGGSSQSPSSAPPSGSPAAPCGLASALHEHQLHDDATLRATVGTSLVGRLETSDGVPHAKDSGSAGRDAIAYRIEEAATLRLGVAAGSIARVRLVDAAGTTVAEASAGSSVAVDVTPGEYTLVVHSDDSRELHYLVQPESCRTTTGTTSAIGRTTSLPPDQQTPGVYVQELDPTMSSIVPAATSVTAFVGALGTGPVGQAVELFAASDLTTQFGAAAADSLVGRAVAQFFANGGSTAWVVGTSDATPDGLLGSGSAGGVHALTGVLGWSILVLPDVATLPPDDATMVLASAVPFAASANAFTIIDVPLALGDVTAAAGWASNSLLPALTEPGRPYAAVYYGPIQIEEESGKQVTMGASGAIAGLYAATDAQSWVWAQPTGTLVPAPGTTLTLPGVVDDVDATTLADALVNALRGISGVNQVWGARTLADLTDPRAYVGSSRTDLMLRTSIVESLQWVVFEPDDETLWSTVTSTLTAFLTPIWHDGGLYGANASDAFDVLCDISNNPPQLIEVGQLGVDVTLTLAPPDARLVQGYTFLVEGP